MSSSKRLSPADPNSYARPGMYYFFMIYFLRHKAGGIRTNLFLVSDIAKVTHIHWAVHVDFNRKILVGSVILAVEKVDPTATQVILDAKGLAIEAAYSYPDQDHLGYTLHPEDYVGSKLEVNLPESTEKV